jgi:hypothetical protein
MERMSRGSWMVPPSHGCHTSVNDSSVSDATGKPSPYHLAARGRCQSSTQVKGSRESIMVSAGLCGCCTLVLQVGLYEIVMLLVGSDRFSRLDAARPGLSLLVHLTLKRYLSDVRSSTTTQTWESARHRRLFVLTNHDSHGPSYRSIARLCDHVNPYHSSKN